MNVSQKKLFYLNLISSSESDSDGDAEEEVLFYLLTAKKQKPNNFHLSKKKKTQMGILK